MKDPGSKQHKHLQTRRAASHLMYQIRTKKTQQTTLWIVSFDGIVKAPYDVVATWRLSSTENHSDPMK